MTEQNEIVREAIAALAPFQITDIAAAAAILGMWSRRLELSRADVLAVLGHYAKRSGNCGESVPQAGGTS